jgi:hypothetical protein
VTPGSSSDSAPVRELRPVPDPDTPARPDASGPREHELAALRADLELKDALALRLSADLRDVQRERDALADEAEWLRGRIAALETDAALLRDEEARLRAVVERPVHRLVERAGQGLAHLPGLQRAARRIVRAAARDH